MKNLSIHDFFTEKLATRSIIEATEVQKKTIPLLVQKNHVFFESETGTGKTLAYVLPLLQKSFMEKTDNGTAISNLEKNRTAVFPNPEVIVIAPTLELASQIKNEVNNFAPFKGLLCFGGSPIKRQLESLKDKPYLVVGSALRLTELVQLKKLKLNNVKAVVLDEVDRLFAPEMRDETLNLVSLMPRSAQLIACSATLPENMQKILIRTAGEFDNKEYEIACLPKEDILKSRITHLAFFADRRDKQKVLRSYLSAEKPQKAIVFCSRTDETVYLSELLQHHGVKCAVLTAKTDKMKRKQALDHFRSGKLQIIVTSDLAARGLDIQNVTHIIQMDVPANSDFFVHRAGRTARAGKSGINVIIGDEYEMRNLSKLEKKLGIIINPRELHSGKVVEIIND